MPDNLFEKEVILMLRQIDYDRSAAVMYAQRWAMSRNPEYYSFSQIGGDCTNFASQCVFAGCGVMNYTPIYGWYYINANDRSPSWTGVEYFFNFMVNNMSQGPFAEQIAVREALPGDVLQLGDKNGRFYHSLVVLANNGREIYIAANDNDALYRPLSSYNYRYVRCIHLLGAMVWE